MVAIFCSVKILSFSLFFFPSCIKLLGNKIHSIKTMVLKKPTALGTFQLVFN